jgi:hypothetical protein
MSCKFAAGERRPPNKALHLTVAALRFSEFNVSPAAAAGERCRSAKEVRAVSQFLRVFKTAHCKVDDFRKGRTRQPDHEFLADCGVEPGTEMARIALAVRRAVAGIGLVDPLFVRAADSYPGTLELLPLWDSMDWVAFTMELEAELGQQLPDPEKIFVASQVSVRQMAADVYRIINSQAGAAPDPAGT